MEGAVTSGRDAATRALACTDDGSAPPAMGQWPRVYGSCQIMWFKRCVQALLGRAGGVLQQIEEQPTDECAQ